MNDIQFIDDLTDILLRYYEQQTKRTAEDDEFYAVKNLALDTIQELDLLAGDETRKDA